jgi:anti-anti-sigma regulatory factor
MPDFEDALNNLDTAQGELVLDFSTVRRIDMATLAVLEQLAVRAAARPVKVVLLGVNVDVYKVLKLSKLSQRFSFQN